ncbi:MAG: aminoacyl-tRNA hydrolase [Clostridia bacterium]
MDYIIVGLGNPGSKYENTRHNAGFIAIDKLASSYHTKIDRLKFKALTAQISIGDKKVLLVKPQTFMNLSGESVIEAATFYKIPPENIIVLVDDISLDVAKMRIRQKGSHGGQNGLKNISLHLSTDGYPRIKIGIGKKPHPDYDLANWVLSSFNKQEMTDIDKIAENCVKACELIVCGDIQKAMALFN